MHILLRNETRFRFFKLHDSVDPPCEEGAGISMTSGVVPLVLRIAGTVSRFIGAGVGVARLVAVSSV